MKKLIDSSGEIHTYAEITPLPNPQHQGWYRFKLTTVYDAARNPDVEQTRLDMCLTPEAYQQLQHLFKEAE